MRRTFANEVVTHRTLYQVSRFRWLRHQLIFWGFALMFAIELMMDHMAQLVGLDPLEFRLLNETSDVRREMLDEAIEIIRLLWQGEMTTFYGDFYTVENARIYTLPDGELPRWKNYRIAAPLETVEEGVVAGHRGPEWDGAT